MVVTPGNELSVDPDGWVAACPHLRVRFLDPTSRFELDPSIATDIQYLTLGFLLTGKPSLAEGDQFAAVERLGLPGMDDDRFMVIERMGLPGMDGDRFMVIERLGLRGLDFVPDVGLYAGEDDREWEEHASDERLTLRHLRSYRYGKANFLFDFWERGVEAAQCNGRNRLGCYTEGSTPELPSRHSHDFWDRNHNTGGAPLRDQWIAYPDEESRRQFEIANTRLYYLDAALALLAFRPIAQVRLPCHCTPEPVVLVGQPWVIRVGSGRFVERDQESVGFILSQGALIRVTPDESGVHPSESMTWRRFPDHRSDPPDETDTSRPVSDNYEPYYFTGKTIQLPSDDGHRIVIEDYPDWLLTMAVKDQAWLTAVATDRSASPENRCAAIRMMTSQDALIDIARHDPDDRIREVAILNPHLSDGDALADLARHGQSIVAWSAISRISDQKVLVELIWSPDAAEDTRARAIDHLHDQAALADIAVGHPEPDVTWRALSRVQDRDLLTTVSQQAHAESVRKHAQYKTEWIERHRQEL